MTAFVRVASGQEKQVGAGLANNLSNPTTILSQNLPVQRQTELMLISGYSGIIKSALLQELYKLITQKRGYFIAGKFDQLQRDIPYQALVAAFPELVRRLLTETQTQLQQWQEKIRRALGINGQKSGEFDMSNSPSGRLWAIQQNAVWTRWAPEYSRWDIYSETRLQIAADPSTPSACYFINPDGSVHWRDVDNDVNKSFPGISAKAISVGGDNRLWAIQANGVWTRWAPEHSRWDIYSEARLQIAADPSTPSACYFINPDGSVHWRDVDNNVNKSFPGISAKAISVGGQ